MRLKADGSTGTVAIYDETAAGDAPFTAPLSHLTSVLFHSDLEYPQIIATHTGSITFPARSAATQNIATQTLFAHGRSGYPMVLGQFDALNSGSPVTLAGSVPVQMDNYGFSRWATLGADSTNVIMHEQYVTFQDAGLSAITLAWTVWVLDILL